MATADYHDIQDQLAMERNFPKENREEVKPTKTQDVLRAVGSVPVALAKFIASTAKDCHTALKHNRDEWAKTFNPPPKKMKTFNGEVLVEPTTEEITQGIISKRYTRGLR